jgi:anaerobic magnesium-protoporphyrin IX monomethyl ester cyclase
MVKSVKEFDIVFIISNFVAKNGAIWKAIEYRYHSPGILSLAAFIRKHGYSVSVFDCNLEQIQEEDFERKFNERYNACQIRYFGFSSTVQTAKTAYRIAEKIKDKKPHIPIIFGGAHATTMPEDVLKHDFIDFVIRGEGELPLLALLRNWKLNEINGLCYKENNQLFINRNCKRIIELDKLPTPAFDLVPMNLCKPLIGTYKKLPATIMVTSRGCINKCSFCSRILGNSLSLLSPKKIMEELEILYHKYNFRHITFYDDTFISDYSRIQEFCELLLSSKLKVSWTCSSRVDKVDLQILKLMKKAGCHQIMYGIESFDKQVLKNINKNIEPENIYNAIKLTKQAGIEVRASLMIGNPGDTNSILRNNIKQLKQLNPDIIQVAITTPLPGSVLFRQAQTNDSIRSYDWDLYNGSVILSDHEKLSDNEIKKWYYKTYLSFYLRPIFLFRQLMKLKTLTNIKIAVIGFLSLFPIIFRYIRK